MTSGVCEVCFAPPPSASRRFVGHNAKRSPSRRSSNVCRTGPRAAILLAYALGGGIALLTGLNWLGWAVGIPAGLILITGAWRFLPKSGKGHAQ